jgi:serine/threonine protein kinase
LGDQALRRNGIRGSENGCEGFTIVIMTLDVGQEFAGYRILRVLGAGAMGTVYLVAHPRLPREDALKVLPGEVTMDPEFRARFVREGEVAAGLSHPHIVRIHDRGEADGQFWISMDYVAGTDVGRLLREQHERGMPLDEVAAIVTAVGSALDYAHRRGLLHRDVKPANILLSEPDGQARRIYLADFGIARRIEDTTGLTATNMAVGTVTYAAPEQLKGESVDGRADQYALACTAFHLLAGVPPYDYPNPAVVITHHVSAPPPLISAYRPELAALDGVFAKAMAKDPSERFGSCGEFATELGRQQAPATVAPYAYARDIPFDYAQETEPGITAPIGPPPRRAWKRPGILIGALAGVGVLAAGGVFAGVQLLGHHNPTAGAPTTSAAPTSKAPPPNTGPITGFFRVNYDRVSSPDGAVPESAAPTVETWAVRSECGSNGCVATASRYDGDTMHIPTMVLDKVGDQWTAVSAGTATCNNISDESWETFKLRPGPDGTLSGEASQILSKACANKRQVTFTRTGDLGAVSLADPAALPPRVVSPTEALRGRYHQTTTQPNGFHEANDYVVDTYCLRAGDRCMSLFHRPPDTSLPLVFGDGKWIYEQEFDARCARSGAVAHVKVVVAFPMPQPPQDPIALLTGHGNEDVTGGPPACHGSTVDVKFARIGD